MKAISINKIFGTCSCVLSLLHCFPLPNKFYQTQHMTIIPCSLSLVTLLFRGICSSTGLISHSLSCWTGLNSYLVTLIISTPLSHNHTLHSVFDKHLSSHYHCLASYSTSYLQGIEQGITKLHFLSPLS